MRTENIPVVVVGGGSAAFEAAVAARQAGAPRVVMLEKAPEPEFGGNARLRLPGSPPPVMWAIACTVGSKGLSDAK